MTPKLTPEQWAKARKLWEADARPGYAWLVRDLDLPVSRAAISKRAKAEGWEKRTIVSEVAVTTEVTHEVTPVTREPGRPSKYRQEYAEQVYRLALLGLTKEMVAEFFEVDVTTVYRWCHEHEEFRHALWRGGALADAEVAEALFHRAKGVVLPETHVAQHQGKVILTDLERHYPPDTGAARLWLKNRQPELWKDKVEVEEQPTLALVDREAMKERFEAALAHAAEVEKQMKGRAERLGLVSDDITHPGSAYDGEWGVNGQRDPTGP